MQALSAHTHPAPSEMAIPPFARKFHSAHHPHKRDPHKRGPAVGSGGYEIFHYAHNPKRGGAMRRLRNESGK